MESLNKIIPVGLAILLGAVVAMSTGTTAAPPGDSWFQAAVINSKQPVVVKFGAEWCGPCRSMDAALDTLSSRYSSRARFIRVNIDEKPELFQHYASGGGIPQIMIFRNGQVTTSQRGFGGDQALDTWLSDNL